MARFRILIVEDDPNAASFVSEVLQEDGYLPDLAATIAEARKLVKSGGYDALILDRSLPDGDGLDLCAELRKRPELKDVPILFLTARGSVPERVEGLRGGGDDYLLKPFEAAEMLARLDALLRRSGRLGRPEFLEGKGLRLEFESRKAFVNRKETPLWAKEFDLLALLLSQKGRVLSRDFLLQQIWGYDTGDKPETKVVDITVSHLRGKLGPLGERVVTVRGFGYRLDA